MFQHLSAERERMDALIVKIQLQLYDLRHQRNTLVPIGFLPEDILLEIFHWCRDGADNHRWVWETTHVCHAWRETALSGRALWSRPNFDIPLLAAEMLRRSISSPLEINFRWNRNGSLDLLPESKELVLDTLIDEAHRIRAVELEVAPDSLHDLLEEATTAAPLLEKLSLRSLVSGWRPLDSILYVSDNIFGGELPSLRSLTLINCEFNLLHPCCANLRVLHIRHARLPSDLHFRSALQHMPHLRELTVYEAICNLDTRLDCPPPVHLPALTKLHLSYTPFHIAAILASMSCSFPAIHNPGALKFDIGEHRRSSYTYVSQISAWISANVTTPLLRVYINGLFGRVDLHTDRGSAERHLSTRAPVTFDYFAGDEHPWGVVEAYISHLPLAPVDFLALSGDKFLIPDTGCAGVFDRFPNVTTLIIHNNCAMAVLHTLSGNAAILPNLRRVQLRVVSMLEDETPRMWTDVLEMRLPRDCAMMSATVEFYRCKYEDGRKRHISPVSPHPTVQLLWNEDVIASQ